MWKRLDWYRKMMMGIIPISFALLAYLLISCSGELLPSEWFFDIVAIPAFVGAQISGAGYVGRGIDAVAPVAGRSAAGKIERIGTLIGLVLGLAAAVTVAVICAVVPLAKPLGVIAEVLFALGSVGTFAGLGNRIGQCLDKNQDVDAGGDVRPVSEKRAMGLAATLGLIAGVVLFATKIAFAVSVVGVTSFISGGAALPLWIAGAVFITSFTSSCASSADYTSKAVSFLRHATTTNNKTLNKTVSQRFHEYRGSLAGVSTGLIVAAIIIGAIMVSQPYLLAGFVGVVAAVMIVSTCVSVMGGLFSRMGRLYDTYKAKTPVPLAQPLLTDQERKQANDVAVRPEMSPQLSQSRIAMSLNAAPAPVALNIVEPDALTPSSPRPVPSTSAERDSVSLAALLQSGNSAVFDSILTQPTPLRAQVASLCAAEVRNERTQDLFGSPQFSIA